MSYERRSLGDAIISEKDRRSISKARYAAYSNAELLTMQRRYEAWQRQHTVWGTCYQTALPPIRVQLPWGIQTAHQAVTDEDLAEVTKRCGAEPAYTGGYAQQSLDAGAAQELAWRAAPVAVVATTFPTLVAPTTPFGIQATVAEARRSGPDASSFLKWGAGGAVLGLAGSAVFGKDAATWALMGGIAGLGVMLAVREGLLGFAESHAEDAARYMATKGASR